MRVAIVDSQIPFFHGGAEMLASRLARAVREQGHDLEMVTLPLNPLVAQDVNRAIDFALGENLARWIAAPDVVVALRFPGYLVQHPDKRVWLLHQLRQYYEYYDQTAAGGNAQEMEALRRRIVEADRAALSGAAHLWSQSPRIAQRLERYNGVPSTPLLAPLPSEEGFYRGRQERYIFVPSRLEWHKRQWLAIEAMAHARSDVKVVITGDGGAYAKYLAQIERLGLQDRILVCGRVSLPVQAAWYANCLAVFFGPDDEDYGFVTLEAMLSGKPVITCRDSGATLNFVTDGVNGRVIEADPLAVAEAIDAMADNPAAARAMGDAGYDRYRKLGLSWERTASVLLQGREG